MEKDIKNNSSPDLVGQIAALKPGTHLCSLHENEYEKRAVLKPFLRQGLMRGDRVIQVANDVSSMLDPTRFVDEPGELGRWLASGQLTVHLARDIYLTNGVFSPELLLKKWGRLIEEAQSDGYAAVWIAAESDWAINEVPLDELIRYESLAHEAVQKYPVIALCQYDRNRFSDHYMAGQLMVHSHVVACRHVVANKHFMPPECFLDEERRTEFLKANDRLDAELDTLLRDLLNPSN